jgi:hypothetical protein
MRSGVDRDGAGTLEHPLEVGARHLRVPRWRTRRRTPGSGCGSLRRRRTPFDFDARHRFGGFDRLAHAAHGLIDVANDALAQAAAGHVADAEDGDAVWSTSPTTALTLVVPRSRPTTIPEAGSLSLL